MNRWSEEFREMMAISAFNDALKTAFYNKEPLSLKFEWLAPRAELVIAVLSKELNRRMSPEGSQLAIGTRALVENLNKALKSEGLCLEMNPIVHQEDYSDW